MLGKHISIVSIFPYSTAIALLPTEEEKWSKMIRSKIQALPQIHSVFFSCL